ncbi:hypothetical protein BV22DRAFT_1051525 [Leucogyrophana mollusca]|uniref:Uncharacterized protein n=1 Tax=Leucogyrophana mollusca TaxID=85980 RepID=A0ACB8B041_9AGAM|nr:hypothetical protein BV22DRAFT_1051525 [Leucogyrophana mollusca]
MLDGGIGGVQKGAEENRNGIYGTADIIAMNGWQTMFLENKYQNAKDYKYSYLLLAEEGIHRDQQLGDPIQIHSVEDPPAASLIQSPVPISIAGPETSVDSEIANEKAISANAVEAYAKELLQLHVVLFRTPSREPSPALSQPGEDLSPVPVSPLTTALIPYIPRVNPKAPQLMLDSDGTHNRDWSGSLVVRSGMATLDYNQGFQWGEIRGALLYQ